jgi:hypothetical protein
LWKEAWKCVFFTCEFFYRDTLAPPGLFLHVSFLQLSSAWSCLFPGYLLCVFLHKSFFLYRAVFFLQPLHPLVGFYNWFFTQCTFFLPYPGCFLHVKFYIGQVFPGPLYIYVFLRISFTWDT